MAIRRHSGKVEDLPLKCPACGGDSFVVHSPFRICANRSCIDAVLFTTMQPSSNLRPWHVVEKLVRRHGWQQGLVVGKTPFLPYYLLEKLPELSLVHETSRPAEEGFGRFAGRYRAVTESDGSGGVDFIFWQTPEAAVEVERDLTDLREKLNEDGMLIGMMTEAVRVLDGIDPLEADLWCQPRNGSLHRRVSLLG